MVNLSKLQSHELSCQKGDNLVSVETLTSQQEILINRLAGLTCLLGQLKVKLAKDQQVSILFGCAVVLKQLISELWFIFGSPGSIVLVSICYFPNRKLSWSVLEN